jgi:hypothetical protein
LTLLNDVTYVEAARAMAQRVMHEVAAPPEVRIAYAFRLATARSANDAERETLLRRYGLLERHYREHPQAAEELLSVGESTRDPELDSAELAAYTGVMSVLLNLDEVITKE